MQHRQKGEECITYYTPGIEKPLHEVRIGEEDFKHLVCSDVENSVYEKSPKEIILRDSLLHSYGKTERLG